MHTHAYTHTCIHTYMHTHIRTYAHTHIRTYAHARIYIYNSLCYLYGTVKDGKAVLIHYFVKVIRADRFRYLP